MKEILDEIKQEEKTGKELIALAGKESEEKLLLIQKQLQEKYESDVSFFQKEAEKTFNEKKAEIDKEMERKLKKGEDEKKTVIDNSKANFIKACDFVKERIFRAYGSS